jgi:hypothetical protein
MMSMMCIQDQGDRGGISFGRVTVPAAPSDSAEYVTLSGATYSDQVRMFVSDPVSGAPLEFPSSVLRGAGHSVEFGGVPRDGIGDSLPVRGKARVRCVDIGSLW